MDSMMSAIKARRGGPQGAGMLDQAPDEAAAPTEDSQSQMKGLIDQLSPEQKSHLLEMLTEEASVDTTAVEKGEPSSGERQEIAMRASEESGAEGSELSGDESDDIAMSMVDSRGKQLASGEGTPRNLGERAKMGMAQKLKSKGKIK